MIHVVVLAPTLATRAGLRALLNEEDAIDVVAEAANLPELELRTTNLDVLVAVTESITHSDLKGLLPEMEEPPAVLLLSEDVDAVRLISGLPLRAWGLLSNNAAEEELLAAVRALHEGLLVGAPALMQPNLVPKPLADLDVVVQADELTPREAEVLELLAQGLANKQIAQELEISEHTVKFHVSSIYTKLGATNRAETVRLGARLGLIVL